LRQYLQDHVGVLFLEKNLQDLVVEFFMMSRRQIDIPSGCPMFAIGAQMLLRALCVSVKFGQLQVPPR